ncbi:MAG: PH domain-containing protein [Candidatus Paceibacterota bacterium]
MQEQKLGLRVYYYYLYKKILIGIVFLLLSIITLISKEVIVSKISFIFGADLAINITSYLINGLFIITFLSLAIGILLSWLSYVSCSFILDEFSILIKKGILSKKTVSIPYKQIQDISIEQSFSNRMMGVCKLAISTAGNDTHDNIGEAEGVFDIIDINIAKELQNTILQKNNTVKA